MICPNCGADNSDNATFCSLCFSNLSEPASARGPGVRGENQTREPVPAGEPLYPEDERAGAKGDAKPDYFRRLLMVVAGLITFNVPFLGNALYRRLILTWFAPSLIFIICVGLLMRKIGYSRLKFFVPLVWGLHIGITIAVDSTGGMSKVLWQTLTWSVIVGTLVDLAILGRTGEKQGLGRYAKDESGAAEAFLPIILLSVFFTFILPNLIGVYLIGVALSSPIGPDERSGKSRLGLISTALVVETAIIVSAMVLIAAFYNPAVDYFASASRSRFKTSVAEKTLEEAWEIRVDPKFRNMLAAGNKLAFFAHNEILLVDVATGRAVKDIVMPEKSRFVAEYERPPYVDDSRFVFLIYNENTHDTEQMIMDTDGNISPRSAWADAFRRRRVDLAAKQSGAVRFDASKPATFNFDYFGVDLRPVNEIDLLDSESFDPAKPTVFFDQRGAKNIALEDQHIAFYDPKTGRALEERPFSGTIESVADDKVYAFQKGPILPGFINTLMALRQAVQLPPKLYIFDLRTGRLLSAYPVDKNDVFYFIFDGAGPIVLKKTAFQNTLALVRL